MKKPQALRTIAFVSLLCFAATAAAQDLVISNGRLLDGKGGIIDNATVVIRDGRIESVTAGSRSVAGLRTIDAGGKTVMPGFVEGHRHVIAGNPANWLSERAPQQMQEFLDAGFTTVLSAIDAPPIVTARDRIARGEMQGPRLFTGTFIPVAGADPEAPPPQAGDPARTDPARIGGATKAAPAIPREVIIGAIENAKKNGYDYLKTVVNTTPGGPEIDTLKLIVAEGNKRGMPTIVHAVSVKDSAAAIDAHPAMLVHTPHVGRLDQDPAALQKIAGAGIPMTSTLAVFVPHFDAQGTALFRDGQPFPWDTLSSAGQGPVNARLLWQAGMVYGYGTDTQWPPKQSLADELRALRLVFSPREIVRIITANAAAATLHGDDFGTLEPGKYGDIVIIDGDPMTDSSALLKVVTTIKEGRVVFSQ
ncbi:MAG: amidohydrolase family protein [Pseudomonadales bacterium]|nr:amidohydrolase family protein [Pseudomonadales bacterium]